MRWLLLSLALVIGVAQSQEKAPTKEDGKRSTKKAAKKQIGTDERPLVITIQPAEEDKKEAKHREEDRADKAQSDRNLVYWTRVLAILAALQFLALAVHAYIFRTQSRSLRETIDQMRQSEQRQLRAYVSVIASSKVPKPGDDDAVTFRIRFKNAGQTPAYDLTNWIGIKVREVPLRSTLEPPPDGFVVSKTVLGPDCDALIQVTKKPPLTTEEKTAIDAGEKVIYVFGRIEYFDAFKEKRFTNFRFVSRGEGTDDLGLKRHDQGNDAT